MPRKYKAYESINFYVGKVLLLKFLPLVLTRRQVE